ncbi:hypothetical protein A9Q99_01745 [Gammaproteobacteria bacterium 45_16_T64]|nr:hypothetical protein A9Q99_01745 [Gammaproteobacteria bacterium 45_16_T64]
MLYRSTLRSKPHPAHRFSRLALCLQLGCTGLVALPLGYTNTAQAEIAPQSSAALIQFNIPTGPLAEVINRFAADADIFISGRGDLTQGKQSPGLQGQYSVDQGLQQILDGSGIHSVRSGNTVTLKDDEVMTLNPLQVGGKAIAVIGTREHGYTAPESVSATRSYVPLVDIPRSVQVISQQFIQDVNIDRLEDALMYIPGVERANDLGQLEHSVIIRGFSSDGMTFRNGKRQRYGGQIDMSTVERMEVLKGPASVQFGVNSPGGIVNVITKKPLEEAQRSVKVRLDEYGKRELLADITGATNSTGNVMYRLIASSEDSETHRDFAQVKSSTIAPSLRLLISEDTLLDVEYQYQHSERPINQGLPQENFKSFNQIPKNLASANFGERGDVGEYTNKLFDITLQHQLNDNLRAELSYVYVKQDLSTRSTSGWPYYPVDTLEDGGYAAGSLVRETFGYPEKESKSHQMSALLHADIDIGSTNHLITVGIDYSSAEATGKFGWAETHDNTLSFPVFNIFNPIYGQYAGDIEVQSIEDYKTKESGIFINETAYLSDDLIVNLGVRYDRIDEQATEIYPDGSDPYYADDDESDTSWNAGVLYKIIPELSLYSSYSTSFEPNYARPGVEANKNEKGKQWELGIKGDVNGELLYSVVYYDLEKTNVAKTLPDNTTRLVGEQTSKGVEIDISYDLADEWKLLASYAYTKARYSKDPDLEGNKVPGVSPHAAALFVSYSLRNSIPGLSVLGGIKYKGKAPFNDANDFDTKAFTTIDFAMKYRLALPGDDALTIQAGVKNVTDEEGIWTDSWSVNYSNPRTVYVNAGYEF